MDAHQSKLLSLLKRRRAFRCLADESGQVAVVMLLGALMVIAGTSAYYLHYHEMNLKSVRSGLTANQLSTVMMARVKQSLVRDWPGCSAAMLASFASYRDLTSTTPIVDVRLDNVAAPAVNELDCLLPASGVAELQTANIVITETGKDLNFLWRKLHVAVSLTTRSVNGFPKTMTKTADIKMSVVSLSNFNVVFTTAPSSVLVTSATGVSGKFMGKLLYASTTPPKVDKIYDFPLLPADDRVTFAAPLFIRAANLDIDGSYPYKMDRYEKVFQQGMYLGILPSPDAATPDALNAFLPDGGVNWNHKFDHTHLTNGESLFQLAEMPAGKFSTTSCVALPPPAAKQYVDAVATFTTLPDPAKFMGDLSFTCQDGSPPFHPLVHLRSGSDLTINMNPTDPTRNVFCGLIVARDLTINLAAAGSVALFGHFVVRKINITGVSGGRAIFYNPAEGLPPEVALPGSATPAGIESQMRTLSTSFAYNFYLPAAVNRPFSPRAPADYLQECAPGSVYSRMKTQYKAISTDTDAAISALFNQYRNNSAKNFYILEDSA